jgi:DNA-directed RNA polymerase specialized sigma24 family protein
VQVQRLTNAFQRYRRALAKVVARIVKPHDIEDIVQETYIRIYQACAR